ncbi:hypothetical protein DRP04_07090, partial [Archaeoglobales archaeon]
MGLFKGVISASVLAEAFNYAVQVAREIKVSLTHDGWQSAFADPANETAVLLEFPTLIWDVYDLDEEFEIGLDEWRLADILPLYKDKPIDVEIDDVSIKISDGILTYKCALIDPTAIRKPPKLELFKDIIEEAEVNGAKITVDADVLRGAINTATQDYILFYADGDTAFIYNGLKKYDIESFVGQAEALYPVEYLRYLLALKTARTFDIYFTTNKPCAIIPDTDYKVTQLIAPREIGPEERETYFPVMAEEKWEITVVEKALKKYRTAIVALDPNFLVIRDDGIYFVDAVGVGPETYLRAYVKIPYDELEFIPYDAHGVYSLHDFKNLVRKAKWFKLSERDSKLFVDETEVGERTKTVIEILEPPKDYDVIYVKVDDFKRLIAKPRYHYYPNIAIVCKAGENAKLVSFFEKDEKPIAVVETDYRCDQDFIRVLRLPERRYIIGDTVEIRFSKEIGEPIFIVFAKSTRKVYYYLLTAISQFVPEAENELIAEAKRVLGIEKPKPEKPPEKPKEMPEHIAKLFDEAKGFIKELEEFLDALPALIEEYNELYKRFETIKRLAEETPEKHFVRDYETLQNDLISLRKKVSEYMTKLADLDNRRIAIKAKIEPLWEWEKERDEILAKIGEYGDLARELKHWYRRFEEGLEQVMKFEARITEAKRELEKKIVEKKPKMKPKPPKKSPELPFSKEELRRKVVSAISELESKWNVQVPNEQVEELIKYLEEALKGKTKEEAEKTIRARAESTVKAVMQEIAVEEALKPPIEKVRNIIEGEIVIASARFDVTPPAKEKEEFIKRLEAEVLEAKPEKVDEYIADRVREWFEKNISRWKEEEKVVKEKKAVEEAIEAVKELLKRKVLRFEDIVKETGLPPELVRQALERVKPSFLPNTKLYTLLKFPSEKEVLKTAVGKSRIDVALQLEKYEPVAVDAVVEELIAKG